MRWLPRRRRTAPDDGVPARREREASDASAAVSGPAFASAPGYDGADAAAGARPAAGAGHWRRLPPLASSIQRAPLTAAASIGVFATSPSISVLVHAPAAAGSRGAAATGSAGQPGSDPEVRPTVGRVTGIVSAQAAAHVAGGGAESASQQSQSSQPPQSAEEPTPERSARVPRRRSPVVAMPEPGPEPGPETGSEQAASLSRLVPRVLPAAGPRRSLVEARDEYVGEPMPDATPYASSAWLRMVESYRPPWASGGEAVPAMAPGIPLPPIPEAGATWSSEAIMPPARRETRADTGKSAPRRASLAESRRLGLGNPLRAASTPVEESDALDDAEATSVAPGMTEAEASDEAGQPWQSSAGTAVHRRPRPRQGGDPAGSAPRRLGLGAPIDGPLPPAPRIAPTEILRPLAPEPEAAPAGEPDDAQPEALVPAPAPPPVTATPVYRFVPGERRAAKVRAVVRPSAPATQSPLPHTPPPSPPLVEPNPGPEVRPLTHPRAPRPPGDAPAASESPAPAPAPIDAGVTSAPTSQSTPQAVPFDLAEAVRRAHGADVSNVPVHRGPEVDDEARELGARAFTRDGEVYLPADRGPLDQPVARGLLAHELTHAAQQRAFGTALPAEDTEAGRALEAAAAATERWARGIGAEPSAAYADPAAAQATWSAPWLTAPSSGRVQRQTGDVASTPAFAQPVEAPPAVLPAAPTPPLSTGTNIGRPDGLSGLDPSVLSQTSATSALDPADAVSAAANASAAQAATGVSGPFDTELASARDRLVELAKQRPLDLDDPADVDELAGRVYQKISRRLRRELLVDRERAGRLSETGPFG